MLVVCIVIKKHWKRTMHIYEWCKSDEILKELCYEDVCSGSNKFKHRWLYVKNATLTYHLHLYEEKLGKRASLWVMHKGQEIKINHIKMWEVVPTNNHGRFYVKQHNTCLLFASLSRNTGKEQCIFMSDAKGERNEMFLRHILFFERSSLAFHHHQILNSELAC